MSSSSSSSSYKTLIDYYFVSHPTISSFQWAHHSSLPFLLSALAAYLSSILLLRSRRLSLSPSLLRPISFLHNLNLLLLSLAMAVGCALSALRDAPSASWLICFPPDTPSAGPTFFWAHVFYLSKIYEFADTAIILLSPVRRPLTFLHAYHHSVVVVMCYMWLEAGQSMLPVALATNAAVHVAMYAYYLSCSAGWRWGPRWKRAVTELQIAQFAFSFAVSAVFLYYHFWARRAQGGCKGLKAWLFNAAFNVSLFALFLDFHAAAYKKKKEGNGKEKKRLN